jgi:hypothetical protein
MEIQQYVASAEEFKLSSPKEFRSLFQDSITPETKALVTQVSETVCILLMKCHLSHTSVTLIKANLDFANSLLSVSMRLLCVHETSSS